MIMRQSFFDICVQRVCNMYVRVTVCICVWMFYVCIFNFFVLLSVISFLSVFFLSGKKRAQWSWECYNWSFCWYTAFDSSVFIQLHMIPNMVNLSPHFQFSFWHTMNSFMFIIFFAFGDEQPWLSWKNVVLSLLSWTETTSFCVILGHL